MGREGGAAETDHAVGLDAVEDKCLVLRDLRYEGVRQVDAFGPLVTFDCDLDMHYIVAGDILAGGDGLDLAADRRVDIGGNETARLGDELPGLDAVADGDYGLGRSAEMLGHGDIYSLRERKDLDRAAAGDLCIVRMHASDTECCLSHC